MATKRIVYGCTELVNASQFLQQVRFTECCLIRSDQRSMCFVLVDQVGSIVAWLVSLPSIFVLFQGLLLLSFFSSHASSSSFFLFLRFLSLLWSTKFFFFSFFLLLHNFVGSTLENISLSFTVEQEEKKRKVEYSVSKWRTTSRLPSTVNQ